MRGPDFDPTIKYDLVLLGDSFFFGQGVNEGNTLADELLRKGVRVINCSEIATDPVDYLHRIRIMKSLGLTCRHVFVGLCVGNDFQDIEDRSTDTYLMPSYPNDFMRYEGFFF